MELLINPFIVYDDKDKNEKLTISQRDSNSFAMSLTLSAWEIVENVSLETHVPLFVY